METRMPFHPRHNTPSVVLFNAMVVAGLGLSALLLASITSRAADDATPVAATPQESVAYDMMIPANDEGRARFGNIFVGEVISVLGEDSIPSTDPEFSLRVILYDVAVEQTLQGAASDHVTVWYEGADYFGYDSTGPGYQHSGELNVGERYLFFAGYDGDAKWYPVNATIGVIPIKDDREAADLVAKFEPLIRDAEQLAAQQARQPREIDPCEEPTSPPTISLEPSRGSPGSIVRVTGDDFIRLQVSIWWDGMNEKLASTSVSLGCEISMGVTIPDAKPGQHRIIVTDAAGRTAEATFEVVDDGTGAARPAKDADRDAKADKRDDRKKHRRHR